MRRHSYRAFAGYSPSVAHITAHFRKSAEALIRYSSVAVGNEHRLASLTEIEGADYFAATFCGWGIGVKYSM